MDVRPSCAATLAAAIALLAGCATPARTGPGSTTPDVTAAVAAAGRSPAQVCRLERPTGSRVLMRVCRTTGEIAGARQAAREALPAVVPAGRKQPDYVTR